MRTKAFTKVRLCRKLQLLRNFTHGQIGCLQKIFCLLQLDSGQYKAFSHIAPYINKDSKIYPVTADDSFGQPLSSYPKLNREIIGFLIKNNGEKHTMVLINPNEDKVQTQFFLNGMWWYAELMADSISTLLF